MKRHVKLFESWINEQEDIKPTIPTISKLTIGEFMKLPVIDKKDVLQAIFNQFSYEFEKPTVRTETYDGKKDMVEVVVPHPKGDYYLQVSEKENSKPEDQKKNVFEIMFNAIKGGNMVNVGRILLYMDNLRNKKQKIEPTLFSKELTTDLSLNTFRKEDQSKHFEENKKILTQGSDSIAAFAQKNYEAAVAKRGKERTTTK